MAVQKLSSKNQIVIPKEARQAMGGKGGDELLVVVKDDLMLVLPKPKPYARALRGLAKGTYPAGYLKKERRWWQQFPHIRPHTFTRMIGACGECRTLNVASSLT